MAEKVSPQRAGQQQEFKLFDQVYRDPLQLNGWENNRLKVFGLWLCSNQNQSRIIKHLPTVLAYFPSRDIGDSGYTATLRMSNVKGSKEENAFNSLLENPEVIGELDTTYVHGLALWVIAQGNQIDEGRYQSFFAHVSAEKLSPRTKG